MQKANKLWGGALVWCLLMSGAWAQNTLDQAIESAKARKAAELKLNLKGPAALDQPAASAAAAPVKAPPSDAAGARSGSPLKLWSIRGVAHGLVAEVLYQGRMHTVSMDGQLADARIGDWVLLSLTQEGAEFALRDGRKKARAGRDRTLSLTLPSGSAAMAAYFPPSPLELQALAMPAGMPVMGQLPGLDARMPVPLNLLKP